MYMYTHTCTSFQIPVDRLLVCCLCWPATVGAQFSLSSSSIIHKAHAESADRPREVWCLRGGVLQRLSLSFQTRSVWAGCIWAHQSSEVFPLGLDTTTKVQGYLNPALWRSHLISIYPLQLGEQLVGYFKSIEMITSGFQEWPWRSWQSTWPTHSTRNRTKE